jgi:hypothetical protein
MNKYVGLDQDSHGISQLGRIVLDARVFGLIPETQGRRQMQVLMSKGEQLWQPARRPTAGDGRAATTASMPKLSPAPRRVAGTPNCRRTNSPSSGGPGPGEVALIAADPRLNA